MSGQPDNPPAFGTVLGLGDDALILSQRLVEWVANAPDLEEDVALANIALDLLGQARLLLRLAGELEGNGRDEDAFAYLRDDRQFRNVLLVELPNGDFAQTMARQLIFSAYQYELYRGLTESSEPTLAAIAAKAVKEVAYHRDHAMQWVLRLGDGTDVSHERMQSGLEAVWPYVEELFEEDHTLRAPVMGYVEEVLARATLEVPSSAPQRSGGRAGLHSEDLGHLLAEMQHLHRSHLGASW
jgi:ring-1,2-phenylacetyl-CoA epoxidase subunit PaaC